MSRSSMPTSLPAPQLRRYPSGWLRAGLLLVAIPPLLIGAWASLDPAGFFVGFPGMGLHWVDLLPPYNEHLMRDTGGLYLTQAAVLIAAAVRPGRSLVRAALISNLIFAGPHFAFHLWHLDGWATPDAIAQTASLGALVALPSLLLLVEMKGRGRTRRETSR